MILVTNILLTLTRRPEMRSLASADTPLHSFLWNSNLNRLSHILIKKNHCGVNKFKCLKILFIFKYFGCLFYFVVLRGWWGVLYHISMKVPYPTYKVTLFLNTAGEPIQIHLLIKNANSKPNTRFDEDPDCTGQ